MALLFSVVVLLISTLTVFVASRSTITEQRLSANDKRAREAFELAQATMDLAGYLFSSGFKCIGGGIISIEDLLDPECKPPALPDDTAALLQKAQFAFCRPPAAGSDFSCSDTPAGASIQNCMPASGSTAMAAPFAVACGWSDDSSARHIIVQQLSGSPAFPSGTVNNPVSTPASAGMGGSFTVVNYFNNLTYWTGGSLDYGNATVKSFIRNPGSTTTNYSTDSTKSDIYKSYQLADALGDQCAIVASGDDRIYNNKCKAPTNKSTPYLLQSTDKGSASNTIGPDVVDKDINLAALSEGSFFKQFFGLDKTDYKKDVANQVLTANEAASTLPGTFGEVIWVDGNLSLTGGPIGSLDRPVVLVVNGNLDLGAGIDFYGVIYTSGTLSGNANGNIYGAVLAHGGTNNLNGNPTIIYDESVLNNTRMTGRRTVVAGSWRDWTIE